MAQTARVTLTLSNIATEEDLTNMEERIMSALSDAITSLKATVANLQVAQSPEKVQELEAALQAEREANAALVATAASVSSAEELEDVEQNRQLDEAKAATDALLSEMNSAASDLGTITAQLSAVGAAVDEAPAGTPVEEIPVEEIPVEVPASDEGESAKTAPPSAFEPEAPVAGEATPTPDPSSPATPDAEVSPDGGVPAEAPVAEAPAPAAGGPVDANGNAVEGPRL